MIHPADSLAFSKSNNCVLSTSDNSTLAFTVLIILASGCNARNTFSNFSKASSLIKSILLIIITSQNSTWSMSKSAIVRSSSSSTLSSRSANKSSLRISLTKRFASTTVTIVSNRHIEVKSIPNSSSMYENVWATGTGSDIPVDSITIWSIPPLWTKRSTSRNKSSLKVQHMHPLESSTNFSSVLDKPPPCATKSLSILTSLISLIYD